MERTPGTRPTLKDIALKTGYSVNTVSRALRNMPDISVETREKIREVARSIGYHNNALASSLRLGRSKTIAVIIPDISNLFYAFALVEIERMVREEGYTTILLNTSESGEYEYEAIKTALQKNVDGIVFGPSQNSYENTKLLLDSGIPFVQFARYARGLEADFVVADDKLGGYQATSHLIEQGHRQILFLNGLSSQNSSAQGRETGYRHALENAGLAVQEELIRKVSILGEDAGAVVLSMLQRRPDITAVFAYSDLVAFSAMDYLAQKNIRVPEDISVVGFDSIRSYLRLPVPLTTVDIKIREMSTLAVDALLTKMHSREQVRVVAQTFIPTELRPGASVKNLR